MAEQHAFECSACKKQARNKTGVAPDCCGRPMTQIPLDQCTLSTTAEHSRFDDLDEPCDDGRAG